MKSVLNNVSKLAGIVAIWGITGLAHAGLLSVSGGNPLVTGSNNDVFGAGVSGFIGGSLMLAGPASLTYTYLGKEASWTNRFSAGGNSFVTGVTAPGTQFSVAQSGAGLLDFEFWTRIGTVDNSNNDLTQPHFFLHQIDGATALIALDDGGAGPDSDYDDLVVRVSAASVPEPGTLAALFAGMACLVMVRRRAGVPVR